MGATVSLGRAPTAASCVEVNVQAHANVPGSCVVRQLEFRAAKSPVAKPGSLMPPPISQQNMQAAQTTPVVASSAMAMRASFMISLLGNRNIRPSFVRLQSIVVNDALDHSYTMTAAAYGAARDFAATVGQTRPSSAQTFA
jgi:hypothetical protein